MKDAKGHGSNARGGAAHQAGVRSATMPIMEHQQTPEGNKSWASGYAYQGRDKASGLHKFSENGGRPELFNRSRYAPAGWHLSRGAHKYDFVRGG